MIILNKEVQQMNKLYRIIPKVFLNGIELHGSKLGEHPLHYGKIPKLDFLNITNFDEAWNNTLLFCSCNTTIFKKRYISGCVGFLETMRVSEKNFETYVVEDTVKTYKNEDYTIAELLKLLPATDFVLWCKDHNLNICPIK